MTRRLPKLRVETLDDRIVPSLLTTRASGDLDAAPVPADAINPALSGDGRFVAFVTASRIDASGANDFNGGPDVYLKDRLTGTVTLVSQLTGTQGGAMGVNSNTRPTISDDGRFVAFEKTVTTAVWIPRLYGYWSYTSRTYVHIRDTQADTTATVAEGNHPHVSGDGRFLSLTSAALPVPSGDVNGILPDIFRYDTTTGEFTVVSTDANGVPGNIGYTTDSAISRDGRYVAIVSSAGTLVPGDMLDKTDVFLKDTVTGAISLVSVADDGTFGNGDSGLGRVSVSDDGRYVAFASEASNLVPGDSNGVADVFLRDVVLGSTVRLSGNAMGSQGNGRSANPVLSGNGRFVAFESESNDLVPGDTNGVVDVFVKDRMTGAITRLSVSTDGAEGNSPAVNAAISRDGRFVAFQSAASNLVAGDGNGKVDVFVRERPLPGEYAAAPDAGGTSRVETRESTGTHGASFDAYLGFAGGTTVALGDLTDDGIGDVVTGPGAGGGPNVRLFDGVSHAVIASFYAYEEAFRGGVNVAVGDVNGDGYADVVCAPGAGGGPNVRVFDGRQLARGNVVLLASLYAYAECFTGGVRVAAGDVNGDGFADIICGAGAGGSANVRVFDGRQLAAGNTSLGDVASGGALIASFVGMAADFTGGVFVSAGDLDNDGRAEVVVGAGSGGPNVRAFDPRTGQLLLSLYAFEGDQSGGVRVTCTDMNQDGYDEIIAGTGHGTPNRIRVIDGKTRNVPSDWISPFLGYKYSYGSPNGVNVG